MAQPAQDDLDQLFLQIAAALAKTSLREGGLPSGAVLVEQGVISGKGIDRCLQSNDSTATAAIDCLRQAAPPIQPRKATLYLTLSPCPMAASLIVERGIARVVLAEGSLFRESIAYLRSRGVEVVLRPEPVGTALMRQFVLEQATLWRPFLAAQQQLQQANLTRSVPRRPSPARKPGRRSANHRLAANRAGRHSLRVLS
jgi:creatinine deaminase